MSVEAAVFGALTGSEALAALVGTRIYAIKLPQKPAYPAVTYRKLTGAPDYALDGPTGDVQASFTISLWAKTYEDTKTAAPAVKATMEAAGYQCVDDSDDYDDQVQVYQNLLTFAAWTEE